MTPSEVEEQIHQVGCPPETYFKRAMKWKYNQDHDTYLDYLKYNIHYIIPDYVAAYTLHLQQAKLRRDEETQEDVGDDIYTVILTRGD